MAEEQDGRENELNIELDEVFREARRMAERGSLSEAFDLYVKILKKFPNAIGYRHIELEFRVLLRRLNETLVPSKNMAEIFSNFGHAVSAYPDNVFLLNDIGKYLHNFGFHFEAYNHFQMAMRLSPGYVAPEKNLNSIKNHLVQRWHFRMLNDKCRNDAFKRAIYLTFRLRKESVLDIGSGTGLLSIYAYECHPVAITGCEASETIMSIGNDVIRENKIDGVVLLRKHSTELNNIDIFGKRSIIITELFDAGLLGENILQTLIHAWKTLASSDAKIIPSRAEFFVAGVKCDFLHQRYRLTSNAKDFLGISDVVHVTSDEPYDSDDIHLFKDITYLTEPKEVFKVNFNDVNDITAVYECQKDIEVNLNTKEPGEVNIIVGWFNLYLTNDIVLTTNPTSENCAKAWQQAVFYDFVPKQVVQNASFNIKMSTADGKVTLVPDSTVNVTRISHDMLRFLNDTDYMNMIISSTGGVCVYLSQIAEISSLDLVDLMPFPAFGLLMLKYGAKSLMCCAGTEDDKKFIEKVFKENKIPEGRFTILLDKDLDTNSFKNMKFHAVFVNCISLCGDVNLNQMNIVKTLKVKHLVQDGLMLPNKVTINAQIIYSQWLNKINRVNDENVHNYKIAQFMNKWQVSQNIHVDIEHLEYEALSEIVELATLDACEEKLILAPITRDGVANAILCWYTIELMEKEMSITTKRPNSFVNGVVWLVDPQKEVSVASECTILFCLDEEDHDFKLLLDVD